MPQDAVDRRPFHISAAHAPYRELERETEPRSPASEAGWSSPISTLRPSLREGNSPPRLTPPTPRTALITRHSPASDFQAPSLLPEMGRVSPSISPDVHLADRSIFGPVPRSASGKKSVRLARAPRSASRHSPPTDEETASRPRTTLSSHAGHTPRPDRSPSAGTPHHSRAGEPPREHGEAATRRRVFVVEEG